MESNPVKVNPSETELWNCENAFEFICPRKWESLRQTESPGIRYCEVCSQNVYFCETPLEFVRQGNLGRCVAIRQEVTPKAAFYNHMMGRYMLDFAMREEEWWKGVSDLNPTFNKEEIDEIRRKFGLSEELCDQKETR
jgi:hypothetical protein